MIFTIEKGNISTFPFFLFTKVFLILNSVILCNNCHIKNSINPLKNKGLLTYIILQFIIAF
ncbi:hypothetical protein GGR42_003042 [Saonia flava]|uniref:Uncharacterized protein n=1 Tax=Saonia flava TaxID=523696 RepID=A0A846QW46_9FLAO|nr:hypothetical protein [Saonia flava]